MAIEGILLFGGASSYRYTRFIQYIEELGFAPLVVDGVEHREFYRLAAGCVATVDPENVTGVLQAVRQWASKYQIRGVLNTTEPFVLPAAVVCDYLGLPGPGLRAARISRDKALQRFYCEDVSPPFVAFRAGDAVPTFDHYPAMLKATSRHGGSGVFPVSDCTAAKAHLPEYLRDEMVLLEQRIDGRDFSVESLLHRGCVVFESITDDREDPLGRRNLETGYTMPSVVANDLRRAALSVNTNVIRALGVKNGFVHAEYKRTDSGTICLMEVAVRTPGDGLLTMYELSTGMALERAVIRVAMGERAEHPPATRFSRQVYLEAAPGALRRVCTGELEAVVTYPGDPPPERGPVRREDPPALREIRMDKSPGQTFGLAQRADERLGSVLFDAPDLRQLDDLEARIASCVRVESVA